MYVAFSFEVTARAINLKVSSIMLETTVVECVLAQ